MVKKSEVRKGPGKQEQTTYTSNLKVSTREHKLEEKSAAELEVTFQELKSKFDEMKVDLTDMKYEYAIMPQNELNWILKSEISPRKKRQLLLTQIGYLRINIFDECYEQIKRAQGDELDEAVKLMNKCAETIAIPFISMKKNQSLTKRLGMLFSRKRDLEPTELIQKWKTSYEAWLKQKESPHPQRDNNKRMEEFGKLKTAFFTLYTHSFSVNNFPPLRNRRSDH
jgi:hypothetical protein